MKKPSYLDGGSIKGKGESMMNRETAISKRGMLFALIAAMVMALILSLGMASPAEAASTSKPYAGYKYTGSKEVVGAGYIQARTYDGRKVKAGYADFYVWSGNKNLWDSKTEKTVAAKKAFRTLKGMSYSKKKNTLTLKNVKAPTYTLSLHGMGTGFKIKLVGTNQLAGIESYSMGMYNAKGEYKGSYPSSLTITGTGSLTLNKNQYHYSPITIEAGGTASKVVFDKKVNIKLYTYGTGNAISVSASTVKKAAQAIAIKGWASESLNQVSQTNKAAPNYAEEGVIVLEKSFSTLPLYKIGTAAQLYYNSYTYTDYESVDTGAVDGDGNPIYEDVPVTYYELKPVVQVGSTAYYTVDDSKSIVTRKSTEVTTAKTSAKVITYTYSSNWMTKLNKGAYYAGAGSKNVSYWDKSTRRTIYSKWHIYKKVATINGMAYVTSYKDNVANKGPLPKGYTGVKSTSSYYSGKTTYSHVLKNGTLTIAA